MQPYNTHEIAQLPADILTRLTATIEQATRREGVANPFNILVDCFVSEDDADDMVTEAVDAAEKDHQREVDSFQADLDDTSSDLASMETRCDDLEEALTDTLFNLDHDTPEEFRKSLLSTLRNLGLL
jgi:hypothetical protein